MGEIVEADIRKRRRYWVEGSDLTFEARGYEDAMSSLEEVPRFVRRWAEDYQAYLYAGGPGNHLDELVSQAIYYLGEFIGEERRLYWVNTATDEILECYTGETVSVDRNDGGSSVHRKGPRKPEEEMKRILSRPGIYMVANTRIIFRAENYHQAEERFSEVLAFLEDWASAHDARDQSSALGVPYGKDEIYEVIYGNWDGFRQPHWVWEIEPETGNLIDPTSGDIYDRETGEKSGETLRPTYP